MRESEDKVSTLPGENTADSRDSRSLETIRSKQQLEQELADAKLLQKISTELIRESGTSGLYKKIVEAAVAVMGSQFASMQMLVPHETSGGKLKLLASSGLGEEGEKFWEWVYYHTGSSCGEALRTSRRAIIPNFSTCEFMQDAPTLPVFLEAGILSAQSTPLYSRDGRLLGMISTHWSYPHTPSERDLSLLDVIARQAADLIDRTQATEALKQSEERLQSLTALLEQKVEERTRELQRSNEDLQKFAHVASHDLKEPVRKVKTFASRLKYDLEQLSQENVARYTDKILESADRMSTMIEGVLTYSSLNAIEQKNDAVDLNKVMADILVDLEVQIQQRGAQVNYGSLPSVKGVEVLIYQVFNNIINNSLKFSKTDERPVTEIRSSIINVGSFDYARIVVKDNGIGFESKYRDSIFKTFTRLHSKAEYDGTGLGLSLAKNIVERHHGNIEADGEKGAGATITVTLPVA